MKLYFVGADHEVTGSCHCVSACGKNIVIDYGMEQGKDVLVNAPLPFKAADIDFVFLTHAHIDHSGMLPKLYADGYRGPVYATKATCELCNILLNDSASIQQSEAEWQNRKAERSGESLVKSVYTVDDAKGILQNFSAVEYDTKVEIASGITVRFQDMGHLLGSAAIEMWLEEDGRSVKLVFSGDVGNTDQPLIKNPSYITEADYVVIESTYGDRSHGPRVDYLGPFKGVIRQTLGRGGNLVIPCFAVGRTQEILYFIRGLKQSGEIEELNAADVYVDSPMAVEATQVFHDNMAECFDADAMKLVDAGINPLQFQGLKLAVTADESKAINFDKNPKIIMAASGMCDVGRIRHHLKHNLWRKESTVLFCGYQSPGCLGYQLLHGAKNVELFGERIQVNAQISQLGGVSGHADKDGLVKWISAFEPKPKQVFVVHGDDATAASFEQLLTTQYGFNAKAPYSGAIYDLAEGKWLSDGQKLYVADQKTEAESVEKKNCKKSEYDRLKDAEDRLEKLIASLQGANSADIEVLAEKIEDICGELSR